MLTDKLGHFDALRITLRRQRIALRILRLSIIRLLFHRLLLTICREAHAADNMRIILPFKLWLDAYLVLAFVVGVVLRVHRLLLLLPIVDDSGRAGDRELGPYVCQ